MSDIAPLDPGCIIQTLREHDVKFVLIGALAARLHGFPALQLMPTLKKRRGARKIAMTSLS